MVKNKKRKGSTLVTVLGLAVVFMTFSAVIISSVMSTMKANTNQKIKEDLSYAAESGLEIARSYLNGKTTVTQADIDEINARMKSVLVDKNNDSIPDGDIGSVKLVSPVISGGSVVNPPTRAGDASGAAGSFTVKVRAERTGNSEFYENAGTDYGTISGHNTDIFDNGLVAGNGGVEIENNGTLDGVSSNISTGKPIVIGGTGGTVTGPVNNNNIGNLKFANWTKSQPVVTLREDFNFYTGDAELGNKSKITKVNMKVIENKLKVSSDLNLDPKEYIKSLDKEAILEIEIEGLTNPNMKMYLVNADKLKIESAGSMVINNTLIVCDGDITISGGRAANTVFYEGTIKLSSSTIFGESIKIIDKSAVHIAYQPSIIGGHGYLDEVKEAELDNFLGALLPNWDAGNSNGSAGLEIKDKTFGN